MKKRHLLWIILKTANIDKILTGYIAYLCITSLLLVWIEPGINTFGDGIWYCFSICTTTGFGDITAVTLFGRILTILLGIYSIFVVALVPAVVVNYFQEYNRIKRDESVAAYLDKLERLPELSKDELTAISDKIKKWRV